MRWLPLLLLASSLFASSRPPVDDQHLVALASRPGGFDAYWIHRNELQPEVKTRLLRTPISLDGHIDGATVLIREDEGSEASGVGVGPAGTLVFHAGADLVLYVNDKAIARGVEQPSVLCGMTLCAAVWPGHVQFLDREANPIGAPIAISGDVLSFRMVDDDLVIVRALGNELRATRLGLGGAARYDVLLLAREPMSNQPPAVAISHDGARSVFAIVEAPWMAMPLLPSQGVRAVAVSADGAVEQLGSLFDVTGSDGLGPVALVWDGARHLLAGTYSPRAAANVAYVAPLGADFRAVDRLEVAQTAFGAPTTAVANGGHIAIAWRGFRPAISVYANGVLTAPVELDETVRRRTVTR